MIQTAASIASRPVVYAWHHGWGAGWWFVFSVIRFRICDQLRRRYARVESKPVGRSCDSRRAPGARGLAARWGVSWSAAWPLALMLICGGSLVMHALDRRGERARERPRLK
jgi:hypothetical protein